MTDHCELVDRPIRRGGLMLKLRFLGICGLTISLLASFTGAETTPEPSPEPSMINPALETTPQIDAICLSGTGGTNPASSAGPRVQAYLISQGLTSVGPPFVAELVPGPDATKPDVGSTWQVCVEPTEAVNSACPPFKVSTIPPHQAASAGCLEGLQKLSTCFSELEKYIIAANKLPAGWPMVRPIDPKDPGTQLKIWWPINDNNEPRP